MQVCVPQLGLHHCHSRHVKSGTGPERTVGPRSRGATPYRLHNSYSTTSVRSSQPWCSRIAATLLAGFRGWSGDLAHCSHAIGWFPWLECYLCLITRPFTNCFLHHYRYKCKKQNRHLHSCRCLFLWSEDWQI